MSRKEIHTVPDGNGGWKNTGSSKNQSFRLKSDAQAAGRREAINKGAEHFTHGLNGRIQSRNSYGNDPYPPRG